MSARFEVRQSEKLGRYAVASRDLRAGETVLSEQPFVLGPHSDSSLVCFDCLLPLVGRFRACAGCGVAPVCAGDGCPQHIAIILLRRLSEQPFVLGPHSDSSLVCFGCLLPLVGRFRACAGCGVAPVCAGDGCPQHIAKWHNQSECDLFRSLKVTKGLNPMTMVPNVGALTALRALLKRDSDPEGWAEFMQMEMHLDQRRNTGVWAYHQNAVKFIESLGLLEGIEDTDLVQKICAVIDVNSFDVRGPAAPTLGCEPLRGVYMKTALLAHDCVANTHIAINDNNLLVCHASTDIKKGEPIYFNYTDPMKGTALRQEHLLNGKYFKCSCVRCCDATELGTFLSSAICPNCKTGYISPAGDRWNCNHCQMETEASAVRLKVQACEDKLGIINKKDEKELEAYIKNVSLILAPNHYLLLDAKQRLAGVLRDAIAREPRPTKRLLRRQLQLCRELGLVLETLRPGISRIKAITLYEMHATMVQLAKKMFDSREITGSEYMDELLSAEKHLKRSLEMLFIEPGNSPEGELCAKALEEYRALKATIGTVLDSIHAEGKTYINGAGEEQRVCNHSVEKNNNQALSSNNRILL